MAISNFIQAADVCMHKKRDLFIHTHTTEIAIGRKVFKDLAPDYHIVSISIAWG